MVQLVVQPVVQSVQRSVWLVVACATLVVQATPAAWCADCDRGCCTAESCGGCGACPAEPASPPCHCQLDARQDQPLSAARAASSGLDLLGQVTAVDQASPEAPPALGVSREYAAALLAVPIRPVRILYGVWRD